MDREEDDDLANDPDMQVDLPPIQLDDIGKINEIDSSAPCSDKADYCSAECGTASQCSLEQKCGGKCAVTCGLCVSGNRSCLDSEFS